MTHASLSTCPQSNNSQMREVDGISVKIITRVEAKTSAEKSVRVTGGKNFKQVD